MGFGDGVIEGFDLLGNIFANFGVLLIRFQEGQISSSPDFLFHERQLILNNNDMQGSWSVHAQDEFHGDIGRTTGARDDVNVAGLE